MRVSDRLDLISQIGRELQSRYTFSELYSYLAAFKIPYMEEGSTGSKWNYTKAALDNQSDEIIVSIARDLELAIPVFVDTSTSNIGISPPRNWGDNAKFRLFISHLAKDKDKATRLKEALEYYSIAGFVAHEDIEPTLEWQTEIERALYAMDAMVTVHTRGFSLSFWTQQEIGFALGRGIKVISLKMGEDPTGFISKHQALPRRQRKAEQIARDINDLLHSDPSTSRRLEEAQSKHLNSHVGKISLGREVAEALQRQREIDLEAAGPKAPVSGYKYKGVKIESRWSVEAELKAMKVIIESMSEPMVRRLSMIWCDSKATNNYSFCVRPGEFVPELTQDISDAIIQSVGGYNGVFIVEGDAPFGGDSLDSLEPYWPDITLS